MKVDNWYVVKYTLGKGLILNCIRVHCIALFRYNLVYDLVYIYIYIWNDDIVFKKIDDLTENYFITNFILINIKFDNLIRFNLRLHIYVH